MLGQKKTGIDLSNGRCKPYEKHLDDPQGPQTVASLLRQLHPREKVKIHPDGPYKVDIVQGQERYEVEIRALKFWSGFDFKYSRVSIIGRHFKNAEQFGVTYHAEVKPTYDVVILFRHDDISSESDTVDTDRTNTVNETRHWVDLSAGVRYILKNGLWTQVLKKA